VGRLAGDGVIELLCDDTLHHKSGRHVEGAGVFRDAVRSTVKTVVYALGLNLVVVCLRVQPAWGGCPIAIPATCACTANTTPPPRPATRPRCWPRSPAGFPVATCT